MQILYLYITTQNVRLNTVLCVRNCLCTFTNLIVIIFCEGAGERLLVIMFPVLSSHHQRKYHFKHKNCSWFIVLMDTLLLDHIVCPNMKNAKTTNS